MLEGHEATVTALAITSDTKYLVSGSSDKTLRVWNLETRSQETVLQGHMGAVYSLVITSDNQYIVSGSWDKTIRIWNFEKKAQEAIWKAIKIQ
jgi:WD40 repeat protein